MMAKLLLNKCIQCKLCKKQVNCPSGNVKEAIKTGRCSGCGACTLVCPEEALVLEESGEDALSVNVNGEELMASGTVKNALELAGVKISKYPCSIKDCLFVPCDCGGCWTCLVEVNGILSTACITPLEEGMKIVTRIKEDIPAFRVVSSFGVHSAGGVGTPHWLKTKEGPVEVVGFTHGCNLRCPQCQNYPLALTSTGSLVEPHEASQILLGLKDNHGMDRIALSGGESTLNRKWLVEVVKAIRNEDDDVSIHIDTNGTILTPPYIDELVEAGMTDLGIDLKSLHLCTYMNITGLDDDELAQKYLRTSWNSVSYTVDNYVGDIFLGIGIPYNAALISTEEIEEMGNEIFKLKPSVQVCVLDYRPEFRRKWLVKPSLNEMMDIKEILNGCGLETVVIQTSEGYFGP